MNLLKQRLDVRCLCKRQVSKDKDRAKYGTCSCDSFSMYYTLGNVIHNYIIQYVHDADKHIVLDNKDELLSCANAIKEYVEADSWDKMSKDKKEKSVYIKKEKAFKSSMKYLVDNWQRLWW